MEHQTTTGHLLDGRIAYRQLRDGHRSGFEPVLLAAAIPANPGDAALELGTGAGAGLLCLAHRLPGITGAGVEVDPVLARLAANNFRENGFGGLAAVQADAAALPFAHSFDHVFANPPWHDPAGTSSPDARRKLAHQETPKLLEAWIIAMAKVLKPVGSLTLILPEALANRAVKALNAIGHGALTIYPLHPRLGRPPKQLILQTRQSSAPSVTLPGLILHDEHGITQAANAILRDGAALT